MFLRQPVNAVQVARDTGEMQRVNRFRASCNQLLGFFCIDSEVVVANVAHHNIRACHTDCLMIGDVVEGRRDHFIAWTDARCP